MANKKNWLLGFDGEFIIQDKKGHQIPATEFGTKESEFGCDGHAQTAEIRTEPSESPIQLVHNIQKVLLKKFNQDRRLFDLDLEAGSYKFDSGLSSHFNFGLKGVIDGQTVSQCLDNYVGFVSLLLEDKTEGVLRRKWQNGQYGKMGSFRDDKPYGFEYRATSSWITSPAIAKGFLCLTKTVVHELLNNKSFCHTQFVRGTDFTKVDKDRLRPLFPRMWHEVTQMELYREYKPYLDTLYFLSTKKLTWYPPIKMKEAWGIIDLKSPIHERRNRMILDNIWANYRMEIEN